MVEPGNKDDVGRIIGAAIEVHRELGPGMRERIYEAALSYELQLRGIRHVRQKEVLLVYKGLELPGQRVDLLVDGSDRPVVVEVKSHSQLVEGPVLAQVISYLRALQLPRGLILNFGLARLVDGIRRVSV